MILVLQIAAGIVLGALVLRHLGLVVRVAAWLAIAAAVAALAIGVYVFVTSASDSAKETSGIIMFVVLLMVILQFSAMVLGWLFLGCRPWLRRSPALRRASTLLGVIDEWIFDNRTDRKFVDFVGGRLFFGMVRFGVLYSLFVMLSSLMLEIGVEKTGKISSTIPHPELFSWLAGAMNLVAVAAIVFWSRRAKSTAVTRA